MLLIIASHLALLYNMVYSTFIIFSTRLFSSFKTGENYVKSHPPPNCGVRGSWVPHQTYRVLQGILA